MSALLDNPVDLSVVIPCHNEADGLQTALERIQRTCVEARISRYEIVLVDDGSTDSTWSEITRLSQEKPFVRAARLSRNFGQQAALTAALRLSQGKRIFILDADLQDPPELLSKFGAKLDEGFDVAYGVRAKRKGETWGKKLTAWAFYRFLNYLSETPLPLDSGDFRLMSRRAVDAFLSLPEQGRFVRGMVAWVGFKQTPVPYERDARQTGQSKYGIKKLFTLALEGITSFSIRPLRLGILLGGLMLLVSACLFAFVIFDWMFGYTVRGWTSILMVMLAIGGVQTFLLGIIGEYVGKIFIEAKGRPLYIVSESIG